LQAFFKSFLSFSKKILKTGAKNFFKKTLKFLKILLAF